MQRFRERMKEGDERGAEIPRTGVEPAGTTKTERKTQNVPVSE